MKAHLSNMGTMPHATASFAGMASGKQMTVPLEMVRSNGPYWEIPEGVKGRVLVHHGMTFNRKAQWTDLTHVMPEQRSAYDVANYREIQGCLRSIHNERFVLADLDRIDEQAVMAMLALKVNFAIRASLHGKPVNIYLVGDHTWALWGWVEAADSGMIGNRGNTLIHVGDHAGIGEMKRGNRIRPFSMRTISKVIEWDVKSPRDPAGIESYILPALQNGFVARMYWEYGNKPTAESIYSTNLRKAELEKQYTRAMSNGDQITAKLLRKQIDSHHMHSEQASFLLLHPVVAYCPDGLHAYRSDSFPFEKLEGLNASQRILDIDIDVCDEADDLLDVVMPHLTRPDWAQCITMAISPEFGAKPNHVEKVISLLKKCKDCS